MTFVGYDVCRLWTFVDYDVCCLIRGGAEGEGAEGEGAERMGGENQTSSPVLLIQVQIVDDCVRWNGQAGRAAINKNDFIHNNKFFGIGRIPQSF